MNNAFLSWEAARRISLGEDNIRLIPSAIGGDREKRTSVILALTDSVTARMRADGVKAYDAINKKFGTAAIQRGANLQSNLRVGKKYEAQMEQKKKPNE